MELEISPKAHSEEEKIVGIDTEDCEFFWNFQIISTSFDFNCELLTFLNGLWLVNRKKQGKVEI